LAFYGFNRFYIENYTQASRSSIKARINELIEMKKLARNGKGRSTWYSLM
jgi:predicted HTH transcriptional regulator